MPRTTVTVSETDNTLVTISTVAPSATSIRDVAISATAPTGAGQALITTSATAAAWADIATQAELNAWLGSTNVTTLGTITTGTWNATTIATTKGGTGLTSYVLGDVLYASATNVLSALAGNATATRKFLRQLGTGTASAAPAWDTVTKADVGLGSVEDTALSTWAGSVNVTTVAASAVTAHQAAIAIAASQVTSGTLAIAQGGTGLTSYVLGDVLYASATAVLSALAGNATATRKFMLSVGDGALAAAPSWDTVTKTDVGLSAVENTALSTWGGSTAIVTLGTIATGTVPAANVSAGSFGSGDFTFTGKASFAGTPTFADASVGTSATHGLVLRGSAGSTNQLSLVNRSNGTDLLVVGESGSEMTITPSVTIVGRLYVQNTTWASIFYGALQVGNAAGTGTRLSVGVGNNDTAANAAAHKIRVGGTLIAAANNDVLYGMEIASTYSVGAFTTTTAYGLKIGDVSGAATNYALYTGAGAVRFGGAVTAADALTVSGAASFEGNVTVGNASGDALTFHPAAWTLTNAVTVTGTWTNIGTVSTVDINGGTVGGVTLDGTISGTPTWASTQSLNTSGTAGIASTVTVVDSTSATCSVCIFDAATGNLAAKTDGGLTYAATTGVLTATGFAGPINGAVGGSTPAAGAFTTLSASGVIQTSSATGSSTITPSTVRIRSTSNASDWDIVNSWGNLDFWSDDGTGIGSGVRARIGARMEGTSGSTVGIMVSTGTATALTASLYISSAGHIAQAENAKHYFDGVAATGDTYITSPSANILDLYAGNAKQLSLTATSATIPGTVYIGDTANANCTLGLTINQGAADNVILGLKSSDVATALTSITTQAVETDDFLTISKSSATLGGALVQVLAEDDALGTVARIASYGGTATTTKSTAGRALIELYASEHNGANALADITADGNVFGVLARRGGADVALALLDEDGDLWLGGAATVVGAFGCNGTAAQAAYASGGALSAYGTGAFGFDSDAHASEVHALLVKVRAALVANGIMS